MSCWRVPIRGVVPAHSRNLNALSATWFPIVTAPDAASALARAKAIYTDGEAGTPVRMHGAHPGEGAK